MVIELLISSNAPIGAYTFAIETSLRYFLWRKLSLLPINNRRNEKCMKKNNRNNEKYTKRTTGEMTKSWNNNRSQPRVIERQTLRDPVYVLFNPYCPGLIKWAQWYFICSYWWYFLVVIKISLRIRWSGVYGAGGSPSWVSPQWHWQDLHRHTQVSAISIISI